MEIDISCFIDYTKYATRKSLCTIAAFFVLAHLIVIALLQNHLTVADEEALHKIMVDLFQIIIQWTAAVTFRRRLRILGILRILTLGYIGAIHAISFPLNLLVNQVSFFNDHVKLHVPLVRAANLMRINRYIGVSSQPHTACCHQTARQNGAKREQ